MRFITEATPAEIPAQMVQLVSITGWKAWEHRLAWLQEQSRANPTMPLFLSERFGLELAFNQVRRHQNQTGRYPWPPETPEQQRLYSFLAMVIRCHHRFTPIGKNRLRGMIEHALKNDYGFSSLAYEMTIAAHLMTQGFDVIFHDMEEGGGFDYLIEKNGFQMEVECKFISGDIGRQIHLKRFHQLGTVLLPEMAVYLDGINGGRLVRVCIPGRLGGDINQYHEILNSVRNILYNQKPNQELSGYVSSIYEFSIADSPFGQMEPGIISRDDVQRFLVDKFEIDNKNVLVNLEAYPAVPGDYQM